jgi:hypothetical protein
VTLPLPNANSPISTSGFDDAGLGKWEALTKAKCSGFRLQVHMTQDEDLFRAIERYFSDDQTWEAKRRS